MHSRRLLSPEHNRRPQKQLPAHDSWNGFLYEDSFQWKAIDISVLTHSDYIMEKMLKNSRVSNVSGSYLSENKTGTTPGIPLDMGDSKVLFGYIVHKGEKIDESVQELIDFLVARLHKS